MSGHTQSNECGTPPMPEHHFYKAPRVSFGPTESEHVSARAGAVIRGVESVRGHTRTNGSGAPLTPERRNELPFRMSFAKQPWARHI